MARRCDSAIQKVSENGYSVYLKASLTTDYAFPFDPGDDVDVLILPGQGVLILPSDSDLDADDIHLRS